MQINYLYLLVTLLLVDLSIGEPKRSFGFGRSRPKSNSNLSVRRRGHVPDAPKAPQPAQKQHTPNQASAPQGPPPAYSVGPSAGKTSLNAAPPAYSHGAAPPSYSAATGLNNHANYPRQSYSGVNSGTNLHNSAPNYGWNSHGSHNGYGGNNHYSQPNSGMYGGHSAGNFGGYGAMPNYGGHGMMGGGMMGGGMMGGGMMGGGMMGGYSGVQPLYMQQQKPSLLSGVAGYALTGLAGYQLARAFGGSGHHSHSEQHIYHHYDDPKENVQGPANVQAPQQTQNAPAQNSQTPYTQTAPINNPDIPTVPLAPFPSTDTVPIAPMPSETVPISSDCKENCSTSEPNVTSVPENGEEFQFWQVHPSLFSYASPPNKDIEYWAKSVDKNLNLPDTNNSSPQTTTSSS